MLKYILLGTAMSLSTPLLAQDKPSSAPAAPGRTEIPASTADQPQTATPPVESAAPPPAVDMPMAQTTETPSTPAQDSAAVPAQDGVAQAEEATDDAMVAATPAEQATAAADPAAATAAPAEPVNSATDVATVVDAEFPSYDKDSNGDLDKTEFASWMVALKKASDPATSADSAETNKWVGDAFAAADKDRNASVTKAELTGFLSQG